MSVTQFNPFPIVTTERLILRQITTDDDQDIFELRSDDVVRKYIARAEMADVTEAKAWIERINNNVKEGKSINWAIMLKETNAFIGLICLWNFSEDRTVAETGYELSPAYHDKGIMTEALIAAIDYGFSVLHLKSIEAFTHKENERSIRMLQKQNFVRNKTRVDEGFPNNVIFILQNKKDRP